MSLHEGALLARGPGRRARHALAAGCLMLLLTGVAWLVGHDLWLQQTPFGAQPHPLVAWLLRVHGGLAWGVTLFGGVVWQGHVRPAWRGVRRRRAHRYAQAAAHDTARRGSGLRTASGVTLVLVLAILLLSAIGLQYAPEAAHAALSLAHWGVGLVLAIALPWHWLMRRRG